jgi:hypothetical protein
MNRLFLILYFLNCLGAQTIAQDTLYKNKKMNRDTLFVYDTVYVTDTVWLSKRQTPSPRQLAPLPSGQSATGLALLSADKKYLLISSDGTATFGRDSIIGIDYLSNLNNVYPMKKASFLAVMLFAMQHMVFAQNHVSLNVGTGGYRMLSNPSSPSPIAPVFSGGLGFRHNVVADKISVGAELNFHYMYRSDFDSIISVGPYAGFPHPLNDREDFSRKPFMINIPLYLRLQTSWASPSVGAEYYYKVTPNRYFLEDNGTVLEDERYRTAYHGASVWGGLDIALASRWTLGMAYFVGLTKEKQSAARDFTMYSKMSRGELRLKYQLR